MAYQSATHIVQLFHLLLPKKPPQILFILFCQYGPGGWLAQICPTRSLFVQRAINLNMWFQRIPINLLWQLNARHIQKSKGPVLCGLSTAPYSQSQTAVQPAGDTMLLASNQLFCMPLPPVQNTRDHKQATAACNTSTVTCMSMAGESGPGLG